jgi:putative transposase
MEKYADYIHPIAETYAYCLMPNHFHLVIRIRKREVIEEIIRNKKHFSKVSFDFGKVAVEDEGKVDNKAIIDNNEIEKFLSKQFSNLFSSYTQSFNKMYKRMGSLFIKNFKREVILYKDYFRNAVVYTHRNPIHHGFCTSYNDWGYTSYCEILEQKSVFVEVDKLLKVFEGKQLFVEVHQQNLDKFNQTTELEAPTIQPFAK